MKDSEVIEILPDGTVYHFDMDVCNAEADRVIEELFEKENPQIGYDCTATIYSLFARAVYILLDSGWTTQELLQTVLTHSSIIDEDDLYDDNDEQ